jgi:hypothetical protein
MKPVITLTMSMLIGNHIAMTSTPTDATTGILDPVILHVAPSGNDAFCGSSKENALLTLDAAAERLNPGDTCLIHEGIYREILRPVRDGKPAAPIRFQAAPGARVILSGLEPITDWEHVEGGLFRAAVDWSMGAQNQVFRDGQPLTEARWPNRKGTDPFNPEGARAVREGSAFDRLQCFEFPEHWTSEDLKGATVWCMALYRWASWTAPVQSYDAETQTLFVEGHDTWWVKASHDPGKLPAWGTFEPAEFYLSNARIFLDSPGEWFWDEAEGFLYIMLADGEQPQAMTIEAKRRLVGIDLSGRKHIHLDNIHLHGATMRMLDSEDCRVSRLHAHYIHHTRGGFTAMQVPDSEGILIGGRNNVLRDSVIGYSTGSGVTLRGEDNALVNNLIHDTNTIGAYCCAVVMGWSSARNLVSHNTIRNSGRDGLQFQGRSHLIQYNHIYRSGLICHDTGAVYLGGQDGENTVIRNNWVHGVNTGLGNGIYLDNYMSNFIIHDNVVWDTSNHAMQLNQPSNYNMVFHNTLLGSLEATFGPWDGPETMFGSLLANNITSREPDLKPGYVEVANMIQEAGDPGERPDPSAFLIADAVDKVFPLPGINACQDESVPVAGAYQPNEPLWQAGHDFENPPHPVWSATQSYYRNYIRNGSFTRHQAGSPTDWQIQSGKARVSYHEGWNHPPADERFSVYGHSLEMAGDEAVRVFQVVAQLPAGRDFIFAAYIRTADAEDVYLEVNDERELLAMSSHALSDPSVWRLVRVPFTVPSSGKVTLVLRKPGAGAAFVDNVGLIPSINLEGWH